MRSKGHAVSVNGFAHDSWRATIRLFVFLALLACPAFVSATTVESPEYDKGWEQYHAAEKASGSEQKRLARQALDLFEQACAKDDPRGCYIMVTEGFLTQVYPDAERGPYRTSAARKAAKLWSNECGSGHSRDSCLNLADFVRAVRNIDTRYPAAARTDGLPQYVAKAADIMVDECEKKDSSIGLPCQGASQLLEASNPAEAKRFNTTLCDGDEEWACHKLGRLSSSEELKVNTFSAKCASKDARACFEGGLYWYQELPGVAGYERQARSWFEKGCDADLADACAAVAQIFYNPEKEVRDAAQGRKFLKRACDLRQANPDVPAKADYCAIAKNMADQDASPPKGKKAATDKPSEARTDKQTVSGTLDRPKMQPTDVQVELRAQRQAKEDAEYEAKVQAYEKGVAEHDAAVKQYNQAVAEMNSQKAVNQKEADAAKAEFARKQAAYEAELARYAKEKADYEAKLNQDGNGHPK